MEGQIDEAVKDRETELNIQQALLETRNPHLEKERKAFDRKKAELNEIHEGHQKSAHLGKLKEQKLVQKELEL